MLTLPAFECIVSDKLFIEFSNIFKECYMRDYNDFNSLVEHLANKSHCVRKLSQRHNLEIQDMSVLIAKQWIYGYNSAKNELKYYLDDLYEIPSE